LDHDEEADERSERAKRLNLAQHLVPYQVKRVWKEKQIRLLGTLPDAEVARMLGLSVHAVRLKQTRLGIPTARDGRRRETETGKHVPSDAKAARTTTGDRATRGPFGDGSLV
jgi:hypothetical protein